MGEGNGGCTSGTVANSGGGSGGGGGAGTGGQFAGIDTFTRKVPNLPVSVPAIATVTGGSGHLYTDPVRGQYMGWVINSLIAWATVVSGPGKVIFGGGYPANNLPNLGAMAKVTELRARLASDIDATQTTIYIDDVSVFGNWRDENGKGLLEAPRSWVGFYFIIGDAVNAVGSELCFVPYTCVPTQSNTWTGVTRGMTASQPGLYYTGGKSNHSAGTPVIVLAVGAFPDANTVINYAYYSSREQLNHENRSLWPNNGWGTTELPGGGWAEDFTMSSQGMEMLYVDGEKGCVNLVPLPRDNPTIVVAAPCYFLYGYGENGALMDAAECSAGGYEVLDENGALTFSYDFMLEQVGMHTFPAPTNYNPPSGSWRPEFFSGHWISANRTYGDPIGDWISDGQVTPYVRYLRPWTPGGPNSWIAMLIELEYFENYLPRDGKQDTSELVNPVTPEGSDNFDIQFLVTDDERINEDNGGENYYYSTVPRCNGKWLHIQVSVHNRGVSCVTTFRDDPDSPEYLWGWTWSTGSDLTLGDIGHPRGDYPNSALPGFNLIGFEEIDGLQDYFLDSRTDKTSAAPQAAHAYYDNFRIHGGGAGLGPPGSGNPKS